MSFFIYIVLFFKNFGTNALNNSNKKHSFFLVLHFIYKKESANSHNSHM